MRPFVRLLLLTAVLLLIAPFLVSSLLVDQRGVLIPGQVVSKDEYITVSYSSWTRHLEAALRYQPPDDGSVAFLTAAVGQEQFDALRKNDSVQLRYLLKRDLPNWPGLRTMRQMHVLASVRLANETTWTGPAEIVSSHKLLLTALLVAGAFLLAWHWLRLPLFSWVFIASLLLTMAITYAGDFPRPMRAPRKDVRTAIGTIKSLDRWQFLFQTAQDRGPVRWIADQPVAVAGVEFVPQGKTDSVLAVDLIDDGSVPNLREHSTVNVDYESASPRVAYIRGATRSFAQRNLRGLISQLFWMAVVAVSLWSIAKLFGRGIRRLTRRTAG